MRVRGLFYIIRLFVHSLSQSLWNFRRTVKLTLNIGTPTYQSFLHSVLVGLYKDVYIVIDDFVYEIPCTAQGLFSQSNCSLTFNTGTLGRDAYLFTSRPDVNHVFRTRLRHRWKALSLTIPTIYGSMGRRQATLASDAVKVSKSAFFPVCDH